MHPYDEYAYQIDKTLDWEDSHPPTEDDRHSTLNHSKGEIANFLIGDKFSKAERDWLDAPSYKSLRAKKEEIALRRRRMNLLVDPEWEEPIPPEPPVAPLFVVWRKDALTQEVKQHTAPVCFELARDVVAAQDRKQSPDHFYYKVAEPEDYDFPKKSQKKFWEFWKKD